MADARSVLLPLESRTRIWRFVSRTLCVLPFGSFATDELTKSDGLIVSDIEVGLVGGIRTYILMKGMRRNVSSPGVELFWVRSKRLRRGTRRNFGSSGPTVHAFDLARSVPVGRLPTAARPVRVWEPDDLPVGEAIRLVLNRVAEWRSSGSEYARIKVAVACGDALLVAAGAYCYGYRARRDRLSRDRFGPSMVRELALAAYDAKLSGDISASPSDEEIRSAVIATVAAVASVKSCENLSEAVYAALKDSEQWSVADAILQAIRARRQGLRGRACCRRWVTPASYALIFQDLVDSTRVNTLAVELKMHRVCNGEIDLNALWRAVCL